MFITYFFLEGEGDHGFFVVDSSVKKGRPFKFKIGMGHASTFQKAPTRINLNQEFVCSHHGLNTIIFHRKVLGEVIKGWDEGVIQVCFVRVFGSVFRPKPPHCKPGEAFVRTDRF